METHSQGSSVTACHARVQVGPGCWAGPGPPLGDRHHAGRHQGQAAEQGRDLGVAARGYPEPDEGYRDQTGALRPGQPTPSITTLTQEHGIARQTAAKALRLLEAEGLVYRVPGLGYYVTGSAGR
jgi:Bacterial regulatory proteins, gntR family